MTRRTATTRATTSDLGTSASRHVPKWPTMKTRTSRASEWADTLLTVLRPKIHRGDKKRNHHQPARRRWSGLVALLIAWQLEFVPKRLATNEIS